MNKFKKSHTAFWTKKFVAVLFSLFALSMYFATANGQQRTIAEGCGLGTIWNVSEVDGWNGIWTRRGNSSTFDAVFKLSGEPDVKSVLNISISGNRVSISRTDSPSKDANRSCSYEGTIGSGGVSVSGTYSCIRTNGTKTGNYSWSAIIRCGSSLAGDWTGTSGAGGLREEWYIRNNDGQWTVSGKWFRDNVEVGSFSGRDYSYKDGRLSFTQFLDKAPIQGWTSGTKVEAWAKGDSMTFRWTNSTGASGTVTHQRKK